MFPRVGEAGVTDQEEVTGSRAAPIPDDGDHRKGLAPHPEGIEFIARDASVSWAMGSAAEAGQGEEQRQSGHDVEVSWA